MRTFKILPAGVVLGMLSVGTLPLFTAAQESASVSQITVSQTVDKIVARERVELNTIRQYSPLAETYIQMVRPDKTLGAIPDGINIF